MRKLVAAAAIAAMLIAAPAAAEPANYSELLAEQLAKTQKWNMDGWRFAEDHVTHKPMDGWARATYIAPQKRAGIRHLEAMQKWEARQARVAERKEASNAQAVATTATAIAGSIQHLICSFGWDCATALRVAECESGFSVHAVNGQYYGIFQMGSSERATYGGSSTDPHDQVSAAYAYYSVSGWSPWACY